MLSEHALNAILSRIGIDGCARDFETHELEFKQCGSNFKSTANELAEASQCFANASGGTIVLGVSDKAESRTGALVGVPIAYSTENVRKAIFDRTRPPLTPLASEHDEDGVRLVIVTVPQGVAFHSTADGRSTRRIGTECLPFTPDQQREVLMARGQIDWSAEPSILRSKDLSAVEFERLRNLLRAAGRNELADLSDEQLLEALRLSTSDSFVVRAGVLLLADEATLREAVPSHEYSYQYRPTPGSEATVRFRRSRPLLAATEELLAAVSGQRTIHPLNVAGGAQLQLVDYPESAVRELVVNALMHRAYDSSASVDIEHSPERLTVSSPGGLVAGVTPENILTHPSTPRHRLLSEAVAMCQLAEKTGQGIDRAYREMLRAGKRPPLFEDSGFRVQAVLPGGIGNDAFVRFVLELPEELSGDVEALLALDFLRDEKTIDAQRLAEVTQRSPHDAQTVLSRLAEDRYGLLEPTRGSVRKPSPTYRLRAQWLASMGRALAYQRRTSDEVDAKVVAHVNEYNYITNRTLQRLFDVHVYAARDMLSDLRARGVLAKIGEARGGRNVRYGPGPRFDAERPRPVAADQGNLLES